MLKDQLRLQQPVVYQALENAVKNHRVSGAYLFSGPYGTMKKEAAILLAQSIFCEKQDGLACEECENCRRVREGLYGDLIMLDGKQKAVSKEDVDAIQLKFSQTALEKGNGERVYIIENCENASISAMNAMLKFLEEPGSGVTAILTTDNIMRLLPTIVSRCSLLPFTPRGPLSYKADAAALGCSEEEAFFLARTARTQEDMQQLKESGVYDKALLMFRQLMNLDGMEKDELLVDYEVSYRAQDSDAAEAKKKNIALLGMFLNLVSAFAEDVITGCKEGPAWYVQALENAPHDEIFWGKMIMIVCSQKDRVNRFNDLNLVMYQTFRKMEELEYEFRR